MQNITRKLLSACCVLALVGGSATFAQDQAAPTVETTAGVVQGEVSEYNADVVTFKGIRYAADTGGANRFLPPQPVEPWEGVVETTAYGNQCFNQGYPPILMPEEGVDLDKSEPSEDCLFLNVWSPGLDDGKRAVMVWFHGGGFTGGSGGSIRYDGTNLAAKQDVVLVTINHRLGGLGFMDLSAVGGEQYANSGNAGMLDIVASLEWVRDNIAAFGGDPANVTVFGESGGGSKVTTLMSMPAASGLFHRGIAESGINMAAIPADAAQTTAAAAMEALGAASIEDLQIADAQAVVSSKGNWGPVATPSLPRNPLVPDADPLSVDIPLLLGSNLNEANFFAMTPLTPLDDAQLREAFAAVPFTAGIGEDKIEALMANYQEIFPDLETHKVFQILASDAWMTNTVQTAADLRAAAAAPTWVYNFAMPQGARDGALGVPHTAEIAYVFDNLDLSKALVGEPDDADRALAEQMSTAWANFAKTGIPSSENLPEWPQWTADSRSVMVLDDTPEVVVDPFAARLAALAAARS